MTQDTAAAPSVGAAGDLGKLQQQQQLLQQQQLQQRQLQQQRRLDEQQLQIQHQHMQMQRQQLQRYQVQQHAHLQQQKQQWSPHVTPAIYPSYAYPVASAFPPASSSLLLPAVSYARPSTSAAAAASAAATTVLPSSDPAAAASPTPPPLTLRDILHILGESVAVLECLRVLLLQLLQWGAEVGALLRAFSFLKYFLRIFAAAKTSGLSRLRHILSFFIFTSASRHPEPQQQQPERQLPLQQREPLLQQAWQLTASQFTEVGSSAGTEGAAALQALSRNERLPKTGTISQLSTATATAAGAIIATSTAATRARGLLKLLPRKIGGLLYGLLVFGILHRLYLQWRRYRRLLRRYRRLAARTAPQVAADLKVEDEAVALLTVKAAHNSRQPLEKEEGEAEEKQEEEMEEKEQEKAASFLSKAVRATAGSSTTAITPASTVAAAEALGQTVLRRDACVQTVIPEVLWAWRAQQQQQAAIGYELGDEEGEAAAASGGRPYSYRRGTVAPSPLTASTTTSVKAWTVDAAAGGPANSRMVTSTSPRAVGTALSPAAGDRAPGVEARRRGEAATAAACSLNTGPLHPFVRAASQRRCRRASSTAAPVAATTASSSGQQADASWGAGALQPSPPSPAERSRGATAAACFAAAMQSTQPRVSICRTPPAAASVAAAAATAMATTAAAVPRAPIPAAAISAAPITEAGVPAAAAAPPQTAVAAAALPGAPLPMATMPTAAIPAAAASVVPATATVPVEAAVVATAASAAASPPTNSPTKATQRGCPFSGSTGESLLRRYLTGRTKNPSKAALVSISLGELAEAVAPPTTISTQETIAAQEEREAAQPGQAGGELRPLSVRLLSETGRVVRGGGIEEDEISGRQVVAAATAPPDEASSSPLGEPSPYSHLRQRAASWSERTATQASSSLIEASRKAMAAIFAARLSKPSANRGRQSGGAVRLTPPLLPAPDSAAFAAAEATTDSEINVALRGATAAAVADATPSIGGTNDQEISSAAAVTAAVADQGALAAALKPPACPLVIEAGFSAPTATATAFATGQSTAGSISAGKAEPTAIRQDELKQKRDLVEEELRRFKAAEKRTTPAFEGNPFLRLCHLQQQREKEERQRELLLEREFNRTDVPPWERGMNLESAEGEGRKSEDTCPSYRRSALCSTRQSLLPAAPGAAAAAQAGTPCQQGSSHGLQHIPRQKEMPDQLLDTQQQQQQTRQHRQQHTLQQQQHTRQQQQIPQQQHESQQHHESQQQQQQKPQQQQQQSTQQQAGEDNRPQAAGNDAVLKHQEEWLPTELHRMLQQSPEPRTAWQCPTRISTLRTQPISILSQRQPVTVMGVQPRDELNKKKVPVSQGQVPELSMSKGAATTLTSAAAAATRASRAPALHQTTSASLPPRRTSKAAVEVGDIFYAAAERRYSSRLAAGKWQQQTQRRRQDPRLRGQLLPPPPPQQHQQQQQCREYDQLKLCGG